MSTNGDKRTVATDALETLGTIIDAGQKRDAIHLAVEPIEAGMDLLPGADVGIKDGKAYGAKFCVLCLGIVDPFLKDIVKAGDRFWLVVYPRQIHSLRHVWTHPAFADEPALAHLKPPVADPKAISEAWLREFIAGADCPDYETVIAKALHNDSWSDEYLHFDGRDAHGEIPPQFWDHLEIVTGKKIPQDQRATGFSCSC